MEYRTLLLKSLNSISEFPKSKYVFNVLVLDLLFILLPWTLYPAFWTWNILYIATRVAFYISELKNRSKY